MACLIKPPQGSAKGVVSVTTQERDRLIRVFPDIAKGLAALKSRYLVGLHHNWHDTQFVHDPLYDFNMAGESDLIPVDGGSFPLLTMDACNFSPPVFVPGGGKFWDVLFVARAVQFKGIPEFFGTIRKLYDSGEMVRVLVICPLPPPGPGAEMGLRELHARMFTQQERHLFTFLTMDWDYPFPFDLPTLGHFYRASRVFVHSAPDERRCRVAGYAWAAAMPVVGMACVGSILPASLRVPPYFFECADYEAFPAAIRAALRAAARDEDFTPVRDLVTGDRVVQTMERDLTALAQRQGQVLSSAPSYTQGLDLRLGRHHGLAYGANRIEQDLLGFITVLAGMTAEEATLLVASSDLEAAIALRHPVPARTVTDMKLPSMPVRLLRRLVRAVKRRLVRR